MLTASFLQYSTSYYILLQKQNTSVQFLLMWSPHGLGTSH